MMRKINQFYALSFNIMLEFRLKKPPRKVVDIFMIDTVRIDNEYQERCQNPGRH